MAGDAGGGGSPVSLARRLGLSSLASSRGGAYVGFFPPILGPEMLVGSQLSSVPALMPGVGLPAGQQPSTSLPFTGCVLFCQ